MTFIGMHCNECGHWTQAVYYCSKCRKMICLECGTWDDREYLCDTCYFEGHCHPEWFYDDV